MNEEKTAIIITLVILGLRSIFAQNMPVVPVRIYQMDDWISYKNSNYVTSFCEGNEFIYFGTSGGVVPYHKYQNEFYDPYTKSDGMSDDYITAVWFDFSTGYLWASNREGVSYLNPTADHWENISNGTLAIPESEKIIQLGTDNNAVIAHSSNDEYISINKRIGFVQDRINTSETSVNWAPNRIDSVPTLSMYSINPPYRIDPDGTVYDDNFQEYTVNLFHSDAKLDIYGGIWGLGILTGDKNVKMLEVHPFGPLQNNISTFTITDEQIWVANFKANKSSSPARTGISVMNFNTGDWTYYEDRFIPELTTEVVNDVAADREANIWVGSDQGLSIFISERNRWKHYSMAQGLKDEVVWTIAVEDTVAWIGTPLGLNKISLPGFKIKRVYLTHSKQHMKIFKIVSDKNYVWIGTDNGLYSIDKVSNIVEHYSMNGDKIGIDKAVASNVYSIASNDSVTIFSQYDGLYLYNHLNNDFQKCPYVTDYQVIDMDLDMDYLWLGTECGAYLVRLNDFYTEHYRTVDGLAGNIVNHLVIDGEYIWFGTDQGLTRYNWRHYAN